MTSTVYAALDDRVLAVDPDRPAASEHLRGERFECLAAAPAAPERVFAGTVSGLYRSTDGGDDWAAVGGFDDRVTAVTVSPHDPDVVWVGTEPSAVYRSTDGGDRFRQRGGLTALPSADRWSFPPRPETHHVRWLAVDPGDSDRIYVAIEAGAFVRTADAGESWHDHPEGGRRDNHTLATHPDAPGRVYTAAGDGYAESTDGGERWTYPQAGLDHRYVWGHTVDAGDPDAVVVSAASGAYRAHRPDSAESYVYRRSGDGWERAMAGLGDPEGLVRAVLAAGDPAEFFALTNRGLFRTRDGARSWDRIELAAVGDWGVGRGLAVV